WMAANITRMRGIENGYLIVRSSRNGLLSITDGFGRVLVFEPSARLPGSTLFATVNVGERIDTLYTRTGDLLGWTCVIAGVLSSVLAYRRQRRAHILEELNA